MMLADPVNAMSARLASQQEEMIHLLEILVSSESPSGEAERLSRTADLVASHGTRLLGVEPERIQTPKSPALRWRLPAARSRAGRVVLLAHLDTVWPVGTIARSPFRVSDGRAYGPGVFDMKAGLVQALFALAALLQASPVRPPIELLITADEEIGSPDGRALIEASAQGAAAVLVLEASQDGNLKVARKGVSNYVLHIAGRAAHAGLEPDKGVNALTAAAHAILALEAIADRDRGTTVTPTLASAGTSQNTVPATASIHLDVRAASASEQDRVDQALRHLRPAAGASITVDGGPNRPPMEERTARELATLAQLAARQCGLPELGSARVGGGSDGNFTAALGVRTLDGLGAVGGGAHAEGEHVLVETMPERAALLAALIVELEREDCR